MNPVIDFTNLVAVLVWLAGLGAIVATNWLFGKLLAGFAWWNNLPKWVKYIVPPVFAVGIAFGSQYMLTQPDFLTTVSPYFATIVTILLGYFGSQSAHLRTKELAKPGVVINAVQSADKLQRSAVKHGFVPK